MLQGTIDISPASRLAQAYRLPWAMVLSAVLCLLFILGGVAAWEHAHMAIPDLGTRHHLQHSGLKAAWANGSVIVVLRHAERCDRSRGACLADPTGITVAGSRAAADVGRGLQRLGLGKADVWTSPEVRTRQTAHAMFGNTIVTQGWLKQCDGQFAETAFAHKRNGHNLVLVSHSGCMEQLERTLDVPGSARSNGYASALFITQGSDGKETLLGQVDASDWRELVDAKAL